MPPAPAAEAAVQTFTMVTWDAVAGADAYRVWRRRTDEAFWRDPVLVNDGTSLKLDGVRGDDWLFGVSSVAPGSHESAVASAVPGGAFRPLVAD